MSTPLIIFDLDGTLAHTGPDLLGTLNRVTSPYGIAPITMTTLNYVLGQGAKAMIAKSFELNNTPLTDELEDKILNDFLDDYEANICNETHLFDGVMKAIDTIEAQGYIFAICTNKTERMAKLLMEKLGVASRFKSLTGGDTYEFRKPDERHLEETAKLAGTDLGKAIMIGDSKADIGAAINAGIPSVAVTFGYSDIAAKDLGATIVIDHFDQLPEAVSTIHKTI